MSVLHWVWRGLRGLSLGLVAVVLLIEEWGWRPLSRWLARFGGWPPLAWLEARIRSLPPYAALALFLIPALTLFPLKLLALWLIHLGHTVLGVSVIVLAKLVGTALAGRLFVLTEPQLRQFVWFNSALDRWNASKSRLRAALEKSSLWRALRRARKEVAVWLQRWFRPRTRL
ncbi:MAG: hypothetical protein H7143_09630 [Pseudorhodobacter sp.]|nr:hypothetical protein [Rhizobacter sp.]